MSGWKYGSAQDDAGGASSRATCRFTCSTPKQHHDCTLHSVRQWTLVCHSHGHAFEEQQQKKNEPCCGWRRHCFHAVGGIWKQLDVSHCASARTLRQKQVDIAQAGGRMTARPIQLAYRPVGFFDCTHHLGCGTRSTTCCWPRMQGRGAHGGTKELQR